MQKAITAREYQDKLLIEKGISQGRFDLALEIKRKWGIDEVLELTGFSREELENEKLAE